MLSFLIVLTKVINAFGFVQAVTLSIILILKGKQNQLNYFISALLLVLAIAIGNTLIILGGLTNYIPITQALANSVIFLIGPILYRITEKGLGQDKSIRTFWVHFIPFVIYVPFCFLEALISPLNEIAWLHLVNSFIIFWLWNCQMFLYLIRSLQMLNKTQFKLRDDVFWLKFVVIGFLIIMSLNLILLIFSRFIIPIPHEITLNITVLLSFVVGSITFKSQSNPIAQIKPLTIEKVESKEIQDWEQTLENLLVLEKVFRLETLTIATLAEKIGVNQRVLSEMLNHKYGKNFNEFINEYRVKDVIEKIENHALKNTTILGLAEEAGFKSNTAFYRAFKNYTGTTPKAFMRKNS